MDHILFLQRTIGNQTVQRLFKSGFIQAKLRISQPGDIYEQEADRMANAAMRMKSERVLLSENRQVHRSIMGHSDAEEEVSQELLCCIESQRGAGHPLGTQTRTEMEAAFGCDFGEVRIHTDANADRLTKEVGASAFTARKDIFFRESAYELQFERGEKLLGHELTHTIQQGGDKGTSVPRITLAGDSAKQTADAASQSIVSDSPMPGISACVPQVAPFIRGEEEEEKKERETKKKEEEKKPSDRAILAATLGQVDDMIHFAKKIPGGQYTAESLEYWKSKEGDTKKIPASAFQNEEFIIKWLRRRPWEMFIRGTAKRLKSGELVSRRVVKMDFISAKDLHPPEGTPLYYALGGFTIWSDVIVKATAFPPEEGGGFLVSFVSWTCKATDDHNWHKLKSTIIPFFGEKTDKELLVLEKFGYGKGFKIESEPWVVTDPECLRDVSVEIK